MEPGDERSHSGPGHAPLTRRQAEVADLIAEGRTNSEIGRHLVISKRTVDAHVDHIKTKLGLGRRAHIVAWVVERSRRVADTNNGS